MPAPTSVCVRRLTVALDRPVRSTNSLLPRYSEPGRKARRISIPRSSERLAGERPGLSCRRAERFLAADRVSTRVIVITQKSYSLLHLTSFKEWNCPGYNAEAAF